MSGESSVTASPREVLALHLRPDLRSPLLRHVGLETADAALNALSAAGFEVLPRALVDAVLDAGDSHNATYEFMNAKRALRAYREDQS